MIFNSNRALPYVFSARKFSFSLIFPILVFSFLPACTGLHVQGWWEVQIQPYKCQFFDRAGKGRLCNCHAFLPGAYTFSIPFIFFFTMKCSSYSFPRWGYLMNSIMSYICSLSAPVCSAGKASKSWWEATAIIIFNSAGLPSFSLKWVYST